MKAFIILPLLFAISYPIFTQSAHAIKAEDHTIHATVYGEGEPVLIINGGPGMSSEGFKSLAKIVGQTNMAIIYDQRGTGNSTLQQIDQNSITMDAMVRDIEIIRIHLKLEKWAVFGHSFGGMLGSYYTAIHPNRVRGLILSSSGGINMDLFSDLNIAGRLTARERDSLNYWSHQIAGGDTTYFARLQRGKYLAPAYLYDKTNVPVVAQRLTQGNRRINELVFQNMRSIQFDCVEELSRFEAPVLIIQGKEDIIPIHISAATDRLFNHSTMVILEKCGHYGWLDQPEQYFKTIGTFLEGLENGYTTLDEN